jgi:Flp pilus assembly CpaE family ATPase
MAKRTELGPNDFKGPVTMTPRLNIPFEPNLYGMALNNGKSVVEENKRAKSTKLFDELAKIVSGRVQSEKQRPGRMVPNFLRSDK